MKPAAVFEAIVSALSALTFLFQLAAAGRTFVFARPERPAPRHYFLPLVFILLLVSSLPEPVRRPLAIPGIAGLVAAAALFEWARRSVRGRRFTYVFSRDTPAFLWTEGPFLYVRNPFYASYLLSAAALALMRPAPLTLLLLAVLYLLIAMAARQEEARFAASPLGDAYRKYAERTGRFVPRLDRLRRKK